MELLKHIIRDGLSPPVVFQLYKWVASYLFLINEAGLLRDRYLTYIFRHMQAIAYSAQIVTL